ncbi:MAG TPA: KUP/HAK/KT family potassium transporter [Rhizomicrobium sp.]|nr:KUP/HAK/KT family potassium transporter [Rhizomicrobium sp.]
MNKIRESENLLTPSVAPAGARPEVKGTLAGLGLSALGVVFGDLGTSPLYTLKTVFAFAGPRAGPEVALGVLSLVIWTLIVIVMIKYVLFAMRIDNDGEGGILALLALLGVKRARRPLIVAIGLFGAALIYGDGSITPAISVLSALEGLDIATPAMSAYVLPAAVVILVLLFAIQPLGTAKIGRAFGPIMALWFVAIGALGIWGIAQHPAVLIAVDPGFAFRYLFSGAPGSFLVLGGVFLCVTGAEALYADMGHFGARPIRLAWMLVVFPSLILNYAGQVALVLQGANTADNIFYRLCPSALLIPLVVLATAATIIASQAVITGSFSMTRQAIQLGWMPRMQITQTSAEGYGQIYVSVVNWCLMLATLGLTIGFRKSDNLASAYGIAVSATMLLTTALLFLGMREIWRWSALGSAAVAGAFFVVDGSFFLANLAKIADGGYVPLLLAALVYSIMMIWHVGAVAVSRRIAEWVMPIGAFMDMLAASKVARVPGTAVFLTRSQSGAPPVMVWHVIQNRALHQKLFVIRVEGQSVPWIRGAERLSVELVAPNFWRAVARFGFMERPDIPALLRQAHSQHGCGVDLDDATYYVGHETVIPREDRKGLPRMVERLFAFMQRNSAHVSDYFRLPSEHVVEIGREIAV